MEKFPLLSLNTNPSFSQSFTICWMQIQIKCGGYLLESPPQNFQLSHQEAVATEKFCNVYLLCVSLNNCRNESGYLPVCAHSETFLYVKINR